MRANRLDKRKKLYEPKKHNRLDEPEKLKKLYERKELKNSLKETKHL